MSVVAEALLIEESSSHEVDRGVSHAGEGSIAHLRTLALRAILVHRDGGYPEQHPHGTAVEMEDAELTQRYNQREQLLET